MRTCNEYQGVGAHGVSQMFKRVIPMILHRIYTREKTTNSVYFSWKKGDNNVFFSTK